MLSEPGSRQADSRVQEWTLAAIIVLGLLLRIVLVAEVRDLGVHTDDERDYVELARSISTNHAFAFADGRVTSIRPPLYPAFVASIWRLSGTESVTIIRGAQVALSLVSVLLVFLLGRKLFNTSVALIAAAAWCFYPSFLYANILLLTEILFTVFVLAAIVCALEAIRPAGGSAPWAAAAGLAIGLAALTRSVMWPFPLLLAPVLMLLVPAVWSRRVTVAVAIIAGYLVVVAPWAVRNTLVQRTFVVVDTMGGLNLRMGNYEYTIEDRMWDGVSLTGDKAWSHQMVVEHPEATYWTEGQREQWARKRATEYMVAHPSTTFRRAVLKFADFWGLEREYIAALRAGKYHPPQWFEIGSSVAVILGYAGAMLLACLGLVAADWRHWRLHVVPLLVVVWICGLHSIVFGHSRYHLPVMPILLVYAGAALATRAWQVVRFPGWRRAVVAAAYVVLAAAWTHELLFRDLDRIRQFVNAG